MSDAIQFTSAIQGVSRAGHSNANQVEEVGSYRGERVVMQADMQSILHDAAEEITALHGERSSKDIAKRKASDRHGRAAELAAKFIQRVPDIGRPEVFQRLAEALKKQGARCDQESLRQMLREQFADVSHQYAALMFLDELLSDSGEVPEVLAEIRELRSTLDQQHGSEIRAGLNVTGVAVRFEKLDGPQNLRDFYRETVLAFDDVAVAHERILGRYGAAHFELAAEFLIHAVGEDLSSEGPSVDPRKLKATVDNLYAVQVARNVHNQLEDLIARVSEGFGVAPQVAASDLLSELLPLKDQRWVDASKVEAIANRLGTQAIEPRIYFLQGIGSLIGSLPEKVFHSLEDRERLRTAVQQAVDRAIDQEGL